MRIVSVLILFTLFGHILTGQVTLTIEIRNLENNSGSVVLDFRNGNDEEVKAFTEKITDKQCIITVNDLKPGKYAFKYFHDENNNKKLDTNFIGMPKEGFGFSNDAKGKFGPPHFEDTVFEVKNDSTVVCTAYYIKL